ncbi:MAG: TIGR03905 family TSCPD domain-containing protein [Acutalibacteraceae bacterium]
MEYTYKTSGTCSRAITFEIDENDRVHNVRFQGGCNGNTQGVAKLVEGMPREEIIDRLLGIDCNFRGTSCPDQLAQALKAVK